MTIPKIAGIYRITNTVNGLYYIGSSVNIKKRYNGHFTKLRSNKHANFHLQAAFNKYGEEVFHFEIVEDCSGQTIEELRATEQKHIDSISSWSDCYNMQKQANCLTAFPPIRESTRQKMSNNTKGKNNPNFGKRHSEKIKLEMANIKRLRGAGVTQTKTGSWRVGIKVSGRKSDVYLGTYDKEFIAQRVRYLAEKFYWDNDTSVQEELDLLKLSGRTLTTNARKYGTGVNINRDGTWKSLITVEDKRIYLGVYKSEELARQVRDLAEKVYWENRQDLVEEFEKAKSFANTKQNQKHYGVGITFDKRRRDWLARIRLNSKTVQLGAFKTEAEAKDLRVKAEKYYYDNDQTYAELFNKPKKEKALPVGVQKRESGKYRAVINVNGKRKELGTYLTIEEAHTVRLAAEQSLLK